VVTNDERLEDEEELATAASFEAISCKNRSWHMAKAFTIAVDEEAISEYIVEFWGDDVEDSAR
jgi:hypothetical protein